MNDPIPVLQAIAREQDAWKRSLKAGYRLPKTPKPMPKLKSKLKK